MLTNFIQNLINRLKRQKVHTALLLITIALGLVFFMCIISFIDLMTGDIDPEPNRTRTLYLKEARYMKDGKVVPRHYVGYGDGFTTSFINKNVKTLTTPEKVGFYRHFSRGLSFGEAWERKGFSGFPTDAPFLEIISLDFVHGKAYSEEQLANMEPVIIIDTKMSKYLFGTINAVGKTFYALNGVNRTLKVVGVFTPINPSSEFEADYFLPYNIENFDEEAKTERGYYNRGFYKALVLAKSREDFQQIKVELKKTITTLNATGKVEEYEGVQAKFFDAHYNMIVRMGITQYEAIELGVAALLVILILLIPIFTIIKINLAMIKERYHELGIRRSFGSSRGKVIYQFLFENFLTTLAGGIIGIAFSYFVFDFFGQIVYPNQEIPGFSINENMLLGGLIVMVFFSLSTGFIPAYQISRLHPVSALYENQTQSFIKHQRKGSKTSIATISSIYIGMVILLSMVLSSLLPTIEMNWLADSKLYNLKLKSESEENYESNYENNKRKIQKLKSINQLAFHNNSSPQRGYGTRRKFTTPSGEHEVNTYIVDANFPSMLDYPCDKGRWFTENDLQNKWTAIVLSPGAAEKFFGINECLNKVLTNPDGGKFKIVGIAGGRTLRRGSWDREKIFLQNKTPQYEILITPEKGFVISQICEEIDKNLSFASIERTRSIAETYHSNYKENQLPYIKFGIAIILIMLLNAGVGFFAVGLGHVKKRTAEIGIRRASGASANSVYRMVLWENIKITLIAIGIAMVLVGQLILFTGDDIFSTYTWIYACVIAVIITLGFMLVSTLAPARRAAKIQPVEALSEE